MLKGKNEWEGWKEASENPQQRMMGGKDEKDSLLCSHVSSEENASFCTDIQQIYRIGHNPHPYDPHMRTATILGRSVPINDLNVKSRHI